MREQIDGQNRLLREPAHAPRPGPVRGSAPIEAGAAEAMQSQRRAKRPWVLRALVGLGFLSAVLARFAGRLGRRNVPLALGVGLFALLFIAAAYNAFFRQTPVARPVLFSTRAEAPLYEQNGPLAAARRAAPARPYVEQAISTEALRREQAPALPSAPSEPDIAALSADTGEDTVGAFIIAQEKSFDKKIAPAPAPAKAADLVRSAPSVPLPSKPRGAEKIAVPRARPAPAAAAPQSRADILRLQKALQKSGAQSLRATGAWDKQTRAALRLFQRYYGLAPTEQADKATIAKMRQLHFW